MHVYCSTSTHLFKRSCVCMFVRQDNDYVSRIPLLSEYALWIQIFCFHSVGCRVWPVMVVAADNTVFRLKLPLPGTGFNTF